MTRPHAIIMAGGSGTRFWPASRKRRPKQFLPLARGRSLLAATVERAQAFAGPERTWIVTNPLQAAELPGVLPEFSREQVIVEPQARDTAPCVALAAARVESRDPGATMVVMPADHLIEPLETFTALLHRATACAADGETLVTFGIAPTRPATIYGYIEVGEALDESSPPLHRVLRFREKPDAKTATEYVARGTFLWNSGIFVWTSAAILAAMDTGSPELAAATRTMIDAAQRDDTASLEKAFATAPAISVDYAVMEHAPKVAVVRADLSWNDVGSFLNLGAVAPTDADGNIVLNHAPADTVLEDANNNVVYAEGQRTVALFGVENLVVVTVDDAVLVCHKERAEELKTLIARVKQTGHESLL